MYTSSISSAYGMNFTANTLKNEKNDEAEAEQAAAKESLENVKRPRVSAYTGGASSMKEIKAMINAALEGIEPSSNGKITFAMLDEHRNKMEKDFAEQVKADLRELGVAEDIDFRLVADPVTGNVEVVSSHADKAKVEQYLKDNPEMVEKFKQIQTISNLDRARQFNGISKTDMKREIQMEALGSFFMSATNNGMGAGSMMMDYFQGSASIINGLNMRI
ncbi:hypothetical protein [Oleidesulfovibrio sp.]|uniref:hypothetical protein n=1 Tax=Oleidesulfovibrio sp. TaxID=2909707 RepID=UPI003A840D24